MTALRRRAPALREILADRSLALMLALGFSSGLPFLLVFSTQSARLREANVPLTEIGLLSYCRAMLLVQVPVVAGRSTR